MTTTTWTRHAIARFLRMDDTASIGVALSPEHPADVAALIAGFAPEEAARILNALPTRQAAEAFGYLPPEAQLALARRLDRKALAALFSAMAHDERADLFAALPEADRAPLLPALAQAEREDLLRLAAWPEGTVGSVMTSDYATVPAGLTAREAVEHLRAAAPDAETIYTAYVVDAEGRLLGTVSLRDLVLALPEARVETLMRRDPVAVRAAAPRSEAVEMIQRYDLLALPVTDDDGRLLGIVTVDDAMDVAEEEASVSFRKVGAVGRMAGSMLTAPVGLLYRKRIAWLVVLVFGNIFSGAGIAYFEETIAAYVALVFFLPLLIDSGGNAGSQSATLMVRALATGEAALKDWGRMLGREVVVAGLLGLTMAAAVSVIGLWRGGPEIAAVVALTMVLIVLVGSLVGMSLPFLLSRLRLDPAAASAPLITSIADALGVVIYFGMATVLLGLPMPD